jgi:hypothetical protein
MYLFPLLALAVYGVVFPRWTEQLDSFAMMRIGAAVGEKLLPLPVGKNLDKIRVLDRLPGTIGDAAVSDENEDGNSNNTPKAIGELGMGGTGGFGVRLRRNKRYRCYPGDHESLNHQEKMQERARMTSAGNKRSFRKYAISLSRCPYFAFPLTSFDGLQNRPHALHVNRDENVPSCDVDRNKYNYLI